VRVVQGNLMTSTSASKPQTTHFDKSSLRTCHVEMDEAEVKEYVEHAQSVIDDAPQMDEANTKAAVLRDFLDLLAWEIPTNTQLEYSVKVGTQPYKVDYALLLEETPVAFFEAKGVDTTLTEGHRDQLASYMKNENVNWGILSNGQQYQFLRREVVDTNVSVEVLTEAELQQLPEQLTILRAFTKDAIEAGDSEKIADRIEELKNARTTLEDDKDTLSADIAAVLTENVSETLSTLAESKAKEMIDSLVREIDEEINSNGGSSTKRFPKESTNVPDDKSETNSGQGSPKIAGDMPSVPEVSSFKTDTDKRFYKRLKNKPDSQPAVYRRLIRNEGKVSRPRFDELAEEEGFNPDGGGHNASLLVLERVTGEIERRGRGDNQRLVWVGE